MTLHESQMAHFELNSNSTQRHTYSLAGWLGYSDELLKELCDKYLKMGFTHFKVKVGLSIEDDYRRCSAVRKYIGEKNYLVRHCYKQRSLYV